MSKTGKYFAYMINELDKRNIQYNQMKLHKLMYFAKAYSLSENTNSELLTLEFQAWKNGPVNPTFRKELVYDFIMGISAYKNKYFTEEIPDSVKNAINYSIDNFSNISSRGLSYLTHNDIFEETGQTPWSEEIGEDLNYCNRKIGNDKLKNFYSKEWFESFRENQNKIEELLNGC